MRSLDPKTLFVGGIIALTFLAGVALAPTFVAPAAAQLFGVPAMEVAGRGGPHGGSGLLSAAATYIGISETSLRDELASGKSLADVATGHGKTRDGLIAALNQAASQRIAQLVDQKGILRDHDRRGHFGAGVGGDPFAAAAAYLGISADDLKAKLRAGQTLAAIANATPGKNRDGLIQALVADARSKIAQAQRDGKISADQATRLNSELTDHLTRLVDASGKPRGH